MTARGALAVCLAIAALGCGEDPAPAPAPEPTVESRPAGETPRGPSGQDVVRCSGASQDPPTLDQAASGEDPSAALEALETLAGRHPGSATARVRLGELSLRTEPPRAEAASRWFARALELHEAGCTLGHRDVWAALEGAALARFLQDDYAGALPFLRRSLERWPTVRSTRYNLACALCKTGDVDGCERELTAVIAAREPLPDFLAERARPAGHYPTLAREDPDLEPLRAHPERFARALGE